TGGNAPHRDRTSEHSPCRFGRAPSRRADAITDRDQASLRLRAGSVMARCPYAQIAFGRRSELMILRPLVRGHEKVHTSRQSWVAPGGQLKVPIPRFVVSSGV